jgi:hypothetical protein
MLFGVLLGGVDRRGCERKPVSPPDRHPVDAAIMPCPMRAWLWVGCTDRAEIASVVRLAFGFPDGSERKAEDSTWLYSYLLLDRRPGS